MSQENSVTELWHGFLKNFRWLKHDKHQWPSSTLSLVKFVISILAGTPTRRGPARPRLLTLPSPSPLSDRKVPIILLQAEAVNTWVTYPLVISFILICQLGLRVWSVSLAYYISRLILFWLLNCRNFKHSFGDASTKLSYEQGLFWVNQIDIIYWPNN